MKSNGWTDGTAALQLFAHLDGEALNVALLMPKEERENGKASHKGFLIITTPRGDWLERDRMVAETVCLLGRCMEG